MSFISLLGGKEIGDRWQLVALEAGGRWQVTGGRWKVEGGRLDHRQVEERGLTPAEPLTSTLLPPPQSGTSHSAHLPGWVTVKKLSKGLNSWSPGHLIN